MSDRIQTKRQTHQPTDDGRKGPSHARAKGEEGGGGLQTKHTQKRQSMPKFKHRAMGVALNSQHPPLSARLHRQTGRRTGRQRIDTQDRKYAWVEALIPCVGVNTLYHLPSQGNVMSIIVYVSVDICALSKMYALHVSSYDKSSPVIKNKK